MRSCRRSWCASLLVLLAASAVGQQAPFALSYVLQSDNNVVALSDGETIPFGFTTVNTVSQATLSLTKVGPGQSVINSFAVTSGSAFRLTAVPSLPVTVQTGAILQVIVLYQPSGIHTDNGQITIGLADGSHITLNLQGIGKGSSLIYQVADTSPPTTVPPGGTYNCPTQTLGRPAVSLSRLSTQEMQSVA